MHRPQDTGKVVTWQFVLFGKNHFSVHASREGTTVSSSCPPTSLPPQHTPVFPLSCEDPLLEILEGDVSAP